MSAVSKPAKMSNLYKLLCLEAAALEAADILPEGLNDELALTIERLHEEHRTAAPEEFGEYIAAQKQALVKLKDSTTVFGLS
jgi:hypothetical protein